MNHITAQVARLGPWVQLASEYTIVHMAARMLAAVSGLLLVRLLPITEYGLYTVMVSTYIFICTFSDLGTSESLSFFHRRTGGGGKHWIQYIHAVIQLRRMLFIFGFTLAGIYLFSTGRQIDAELQNLLLGFLLIGLAAWFTILSSVNSYVQRLKQRFRLAYVVELTNEVTKLLAVGLIWVFSLITALAGIASVSIGAIIAAITSIKLLDLKSNIEHAHFMKWRVNRYKRIVLGQVLPILPGAVHFTLQGLLIVLLAAYYGSTTNVAEVGALSRIAGLFAILAGFTRGVIIPRFAAMRNDRLFFQRYLLWSTILLMLGVTLILDSA